MDHVKLANGMIDAADNRFQRSDVPYDGIVQANLAVAHAILALVERLDNLTTDGLDGRTGLNVMADLVDR